MSLVSRGILNVTAAVVKRPFTPNSMKVEGWWRHVIHMHKPGKGDLLIDFLLVLSFHHPLLQPLRLPVASFRRQSMAEAKRRKFLCEMSTKDHCGRCRHNLISAQFPALRFGHFFKLIFKLKVKQWAAGPNF